MKNRKVLLDLSINALFIALIILFSYVPYLGFISIGPVSFTTIHIIVLIGAMIFGKWHGLLYGFFFGLFSLAIAVGRPSTADFFFANPFVSVLPRIIFGFIAGAIFDYYRKRLEKPLFIAICAPIAGILTFMHTFLTLSCFYVFGFLDIFGISKAMGMADLIASVTELFGSFGNFLLINITTGMVCEIAAAIVVTPSVSSLYVYNKMPINFYKLQVVQEVGTAEKKLDKKITYASIATFCVLVVAFSALLLTLFYTK